MLQIFSTREIASCFWIIIFILYCAISKKVRSSFFALIQFALKPKLFFPALIFLVYAMIIVFVLSFFPLWKWKFVKDISLWFIFVGLAMCYNAMNFDTKSHYFRRILFDNIKLMVFVEFLVSSFTFSLIAELIILPITTFIMLMNAFSTNKPQYALVNKAFFVLQAITGLLILSFSLKVAVAEYKTLNGVDMLISFILPIFFTLLFIPVAFLFALYAKYELLFIRMGFREPDDKDLKVWHRKLAFQTCGLSLSKIASFDRYFAIKMFKTMTKEEFSNLVNEFRSNYKERSSERHL